jgi:hypothetical protein
VEQKTEIRKWKLFWAWQDEKEEAWLRQMAQEGLHLKSPGLGMYTFQPGDAQDTIDGCVLDDPVCCCHAAAYPAHQ